MDFPTLAWSQSVGSFVFSHLYGFDVEFNAYNLGCALQGFLQNIYIKAHVWMDPWTHNCGRMEFKFEQSPLARLPMQSMILHMSKCMGSIQLMLEINLTVIFFLVKSTSNIS